jgi:hypothetical protein
MGTFKSDDPVGRSLKTLQQVCNPNADCRLPPSTPTPSSCLRTIYSIHWQSSRSSACWPLSVRLVSSIMSSKAPIHIQNWIIPGSLLARWIKSRPSNAPRRCNCLVHVHSPLRLWLFFLNSGGSTLRTEQFQTNVCNRSPVLDFCTCKFILKSLGVSTFHDSRVCGQSDKHLSYIYIQLLVCRLSSPLHLTLMKCNLCGVEHLRQSNELAFQALTGWPDRQCTISGPTGY